MADPNDNAPAPPSGGLFARLSRGWKALSKRLSDHFAEYGAVAIVVYFTIFFATWAGMTLAIRSGVSVDGAAGETGSIGAAYVATKLTQPLRILVTLAITPFAAMLWDRIRGRSKPAPELPPADPPAPKS